MSLMILNIRRTAIFKLITVQKMILRELQLRIFPTRKDGYWGLYRYTPSHILLPK